MVLYVRPSDDIKPTFFANGGDRKKTNTPEVDVCNELGIELLWGVGGNSKSASSSELVKRAKRHQNEDKYSRSNRNNTFRKIEIFKKKLNSY